MARLTGSIAGRMLLLATAMAIITMIVGMVAYYIATEYELLQMTAHMPPKARAEISRLIASGQRGSDRYFQIFNRYGGNMPSPTDLWFLGLIGIISVFSGGMIALPLSRRITGPITAVARAAAQVSAGDRTVRVDRGHTSGETGELVDSFNKMAAAIEAYERERIVLTAGIAHELRTPLTILAGRLHGLLDGVIDPAGGEASRLLRQVEQLSRQVEDLRTLAHADAGELTLDRQMLDLGKLVATAIEDLRPPASAQGVEFDENYAPVAVFGDPSRLTQIIVNILTNAIKHAPGGSCISVVVEARDGEAVVRVIDAGAGFLLTDAARLFIPFWRAGADKRAGRPGSGIGLTLAAKLAEAHGGRIKASNRPDGSGAIFSLHVPLRERSFFD